MISWAHPRLRICLKFHVFVGSDRAVLYIFAATTSNFQFRNLRVAAKDAVPIPCAKLGLQEKLRLNRYTISKEIQS